MENNEKLTTNKQIIAFLAEKFPQCFTTDGEAKPLKIGIFQDIAERLEGDDRVSKTSLRAALRHYTSSWRYLHGSREGAVRVDLDGNDCGALEAEHIEHAKKTLKESKAKVFGPRRQQGDKAGANSRAESAVSKSAAGAVDGRAEQKAGRKPSNRPKAVKTRRPKPQPLDPQALGVGQLVKVLVGKRPVPATILELGKGEAQVQLNTGMTVKVKVEHLIG